MPRVLCLALLLIFISFSQMAEAQQRRSPFGTNRVSLATLPPVQEVLKLNDDQKKKADELHDQLTEDRSDVFQTSGGDFEAMRIDLEEIDAEVTKEFSEVLDDTQKTRLTEIYVQANGPNSLADTEVQETLKITPEQTEKFEEIQEQNRQAFFDSFQDFQGMSDEERREAFTKLRQEADDRLLGGLTEEQRAAFEKLPGEEVDYDLSELRGGFGGGGGGGRAGGTNSSRPQRPQ